MTQKNRKITACLVFTIAKLDLVTGFYIDEDEDKLIAGGTDAMDLYDSLENYWNDLRQNRKSNGEI